MLLYRLLMVFSVMCSGLIVCRLLVLWVIVLMILLMLMFFWLLLCLVMCMLLGLCGGVRVKLDEVLCLVMVDVGMMCLWIMGLMVFMDGFLRWKLLCWFGRGWVDVMVLKFKYLFLCVGFGVWFLWRYCVDM